MKIFSLFSGIGGFDLACQRHGHRIIGACEIDRYARAVYARHFTGVPIHKDVTKIRPEELPDFDILCAGFPCQDYSIAGKRLGFKESRGKLFFEIVRIAKEKRPRFLLLENVKGLLSHDRGKTFAIILTALDEIGYDAQWQVLNSKYFVPQNRERVFIIANLREEPRPEVFPLGFNGEEVNEDWPNVRTITGGGNAGGMHSQMTGIIINKGITKEQTISNCVDASCWKGHDSHGQRTLIEVARISGHEKRQTGRIYHSDGLARTMCSGSGGMGKNTGMYQINGRVRRLTPLECERLQGFPEIENLTTIHIQNNQCFVDHQKNFVSVETPNHKSQKYVGSAEKDRMSENALYVLNNLNSKNQQTNKLAPNHVHICLEQDTLQILNQGKLLFSVNNVEKKNLCLHQTDIEDFVHRLVLMSTTLEKITPNGKEESLQNENNLQLLKNGKTRSNLSGNEIMQHVKDAKQDTRMTNQHFTFIISNHSDINSLEMTEKTSFYSALNVIIGYIQKITKIENSPISVYRKSGFTSGVSDTQRYRCLGNAVTVPVVEYIMKKLGSSAKLEIKPVCGHHDDTGCRK